MPATEDDKKKPFFPLCLSATGVVYGDVGTSPLYTVKAIFSESHGLKPDQGNVFGAISLIFWALLLVICLKYIVFIMRADNRGEGGIMALMALALRSRHRANQRILITTLGLFGAALFYGDGIITPAISVLSAAEGLEVASPMLHAYILPLAVTVLVALFVFQRMGAEKVGFLFGPIMLLWFLCLSVLGAWAIMRHPEIIHAIHPKYAVHFFADNGWSGFLALGAVVLAITGAEALYAYMGHFGRKPIQLTWLVFVMPALLLNYLGQGALLLEHPEAVKNPFFLLAPEWALYPLIILSIVTTAIASQAVIAGAFSVTRQAVQLDYLPRQRFVHTSNSEMGQIYAPAVNKLLLFAVVGLVLSFQCSGELASAYGFAVTGTMAIDTSLAFIVALDVWKWSPRVAGLFLAIFLSVDLALLLANTVKIVDGAWFPLLIGALIFLLMSTWKKGRRALAWHLQKSSISLTEFLRRIEANPLHRVPGTAIFLYTRHISMPYALLQNVECNQILHERVILLTAITQDIPYVSAKDRLEVEDLGQNFFRITVHFGFAQSPDIPHALGLGSASGLSLDLDTTFFYLGRETLIPSDNPALNAWQERIFIFMFRNASNPISFFGIPTHRAVEIGKLVEI